MIARIVKLICELVKNVILCSYEATCYFQEDIPQDNEAKMQL
jgi:hypothetical protein